MPKKDISEPSFGFGRGGDREFVLPGNREYVAGDRIPRPEGSGSGGGGGSGRRGRQRGRRSCSRCRAKSSCRSSSTTSSCPNLARTEMGHTSARRASVPATRSRACPPISPSIRTLRAVARAPDRARAAASRARREAVEAAFAVAVAAGHARRARAVSRRARARCERRRGSAAVPRRAATCATATASWQPGADRARRDVLPDGRVGVDGRGQEGPREALLHAALSVPHPQVRRGGPDLHPPHRRRRGGRRGHVLPRHALRRHRRLFGARACRQDPRRALRERLERLRGAGVRRRRFRRRSGAQRAVPAASACCRRRATTPISSSPRRSTQDHSSTLWAEYERVAEAHAAISR